MSTKTPAKLPRLSAQDIARCANPPVGDDTLRDVATIIENVRTGGERAIREYAHRFDGLDADAPLVLDRETMCAALQRIDPADRAVLERTAERIRSFAEAQRAMFKPVTVEVPGGYAGHTVEPIESAGCYAPAGRYPLPSSVLMTAITARTAGCARVVVASPGTSDIMLAAAAIARADEYLRLGGAHAVAALAYGWPGFRRVDVVVGPGNKWVTGAKQLVSGVVGIDMLAGPSELLVIADDSADPQVVAADLLAQAEHDTDARAMLVTTSAPLAAEVDDEIARQLESLPTRGTAETSLCNGFICVVDDIERAVEISDAIAAEHVEVFTRGAEIVSARLRNAGGVFIGRQSGEVYGDYGAGPNHTLPTGGTARFQAGLSVSHFLRLRTWLRIDSLAATGRLIGDAARLGEIEGLYGHAASVRVRCEHESSV